MKFAERLREHLVQSLRQVDLNNWDTPRFGPEPLRQRCKGRLLRLLYMTPLAGRVRSRILARAITSLQPFEELLDATYRALADDASRDTLVAVWAYRLLGHLFARLPLQTPDYWARFSALEAAADPVDAIPAGFNQWMLHRFTVEPVDASHEPVNIYLTPKGVLTELILQQYRCPRADGAALEARPGDVVVDGGACFGDTALYFANRVGPEGTVLSLEFLPSNLAIFERNMSLNPRLAGRVRLERHPLWSEADQSLFISGSGPAARVGLLPPPGPCETVQTTTVDALARKHGVKIRFIKLDIEGAELPALRGAEQVLRRDLPTLAVAVYHRPQDFWEIREWLASLGLGYRFWLRHFTVHAEETVLFAAVGDGG